LAAILLIFLVFTGLVATGQSIVQALDGIIHSPQIYAAYVAPFIFLSLIATGLTFAIFRNIAKT
jgi:biopolymer transport protein ExbB/TolQ